MEFDNPLLPRFVVTAVIACCVGIVLGYFLIRKYVQTQSRPLLFMLFPAICIIGVVMNQSLMRLYELTAPPGFTAWDRPWSLNLAGSLLSAGVGVSGAILSQQVFRPGVLWAKGLAAVLTAGIVVAFTLPYVVEGAVESRPVYATPTSKWLALGFGGAVWLWAAYESFSLYRVFRGEMRNGVDRDPLVVNRFALWGWMAVCMMLSYLFLIPAGTEMFQSQAIPAPMALSGAAGFSAMILLVVAWLPPAWYRRRFSPQP